jgi:excinuclease UvrABC ATPase subunit
VKTPCEICQGRRFKDEVLAYKLNGKSNSDVLALTVAQALDFFKQKVIVRKLQAMSDVGLGLPWARPAIEHVVGRRVPADQAGERAAQTGQHLRTR